MSKLGKDVCDGFGNFLRVGHALEVQSADNITIVGAFEQVRLDVVVGGGAFVQRILGSLGNTPMGVFRSSIVILLSGLGLAFLRLGRALCVMVHFRQRRVRLLLRLSVVLRLVVGFRHTTFQLGLERVSDGGLFLVDVAAGIDFLGRFCVLRTWVSRFLVVAARALSALRVLIVVFSVRLGLGTVRIRLIRFVRT